MLWNSQVHMGTISLPAVSVITAPILLLTEKCKHVFPFFFFGKPIGMTHF